ncbi:glycosyl hydrolase [Stachybotrys elegans]|uniref:Glycosyl hydrolase n=1 Tax=Stachybotrys elegans TaxID=80388 RepID=A0A8K0SIP7_9HYPO|nr:glycosyl hydrolase [Stachybotrys elegans]
MLVWALFLVACVASGQSEDLTKYVRTDTGSIDGGNTFPGVTWPLGMVKLGPDLENGADSYSGYQPNGNFTGFSMLHESGTGGAPKYGVVSQLPLIGSITNPLDNLHDTRASPDVTEVGYYRSSLGSGIVVELAARTRGGLYRYTFPNGTMDRNIVVDVSHVLPSYRGQGLGQNYLGGQIDIKEDDEQIHYEGYGIYDNGWNRAAPWRVYFCGYFDTPVAYQTFLSDGRTSDVLVEYGNKTTYESAEARLGAVFFVKNTVVQSRVGVSFISSEQACRNIQEQIPAGTSLETVRDMTKSAWNTDVLSKFTTTDTNETMKTQLYTAMYFTSLLPTNKTGENPLWESSEPYYDDIFTFWDTFRCTTSLLHVLQPEAYEEFIRSLIDVWRHEGYVSDARSSNWNGAVQGGSNSDNVMADAFVKGVRGKIDWNDGFAAMVKNAEVTPPNDDDSRDPSGSVKEGRGALPDWIEHGFITPNFTRSVSRAIEYAANDFALSQVAHGLDNATAAAKYLVRSRNWRNQWNPNMTALGHTGFLGPRDLDDFLDQDPMSCGGCYWGDYYYQGLPWEYSFNAHHDIAEIVSLVGGRDRFIDRLEKLFTPGLIDGNAQFGNTMFNPGNEPSFGTPYLYNFVNRQDLSVRRSRHVAKSYYRPTPDGLPGNSDAGAMESWLLWNMIGLYPLTGQTTFLIGSPWFQDLTIHLAEGKELHISSSGGSEERFYVQSMKVNGEDWNKSWLAWADVFENGGTMEFVLGDIPTNWTTGPLPPSPASEGRYM